MKRIFVFCAAICWLVPIAHAQEAGDVEEAGADVSSDVEADDTEAMADDAADDADDLADDSVEGGAETVPAAASVDVPAGSTAGDASYGVRIRELEGQLDELKEDVFRSKSRLYLLREQIVQDSVGNARATITHVNEFGRTFELLEIRYSLDGTPVFSATKAADGIEDIESIELYSGVVLPGVHNLAVQMMVRGKPRGPFTYARGYEFEITTSHTFSVEGGQAVDLDVVTYSGGNAHEDFSRRPDVRFDEQTASSGGGPAPAATSQDDESMTAPASDTE